MCYTNKSRGCLDNSFRQMHDSHVTWVTSMYAYVLSVICFLVQQALNYLIGHSLESVYGYYQKKSENYY